MAEVAMIASGMGIASLGIQVADGILRLKYFWARVKDAPEEIKYLTEELETVQIIISDLSALQSETGGDFETEAESLSRCMMLCERGCRSLQALLSDLKCQIEGRKIIGGVKAALKRGQIDKLRERLRSAQGLLMLSHQIYMWFVYFFIFWLA